MGSAKHEDAAYMPPDSNPHELRVIHERDKRLQKENAELRATIAELGHQVDALERVIENLRQEVADARKAK